MQFKYLLLLVVSIFLSHFLSAQITGKCASDLLYYETLAKDSSILLKAKSIEEKIKLWEKKAPDTLLNNVIITIPVVVHVIHNGEMVGVGANISDEQILSQIEVLNKDFRHLNSDSLNSSHPYWSTTADCNIEFCFAKYDEYGIPTNGITRLDSEIDAWERSMFDSQIKPATIWDRNKYLNIWSVNLSPPDLLGFGTFPATATDSTDGVVIRYQAFGNTGTAGSGGYSDYNMGRNGVHEVGHWLNLFHIWGSDMVTCGTDSVGDTEPALYPNFDCKTFPYNSNNICGSSSNGEMFMNYMDYTDDECKNMFTKGQRDRMHATLEVARHSILTSSACQTESTCDVPTILKVDPITTTSAVVHWKVVPYSKEYKLLYKEVTDSVWISKLVLYTSITLSNLEAGKSYEVRMASVCENEESEFSEPTTFTTVDVVCNPPSWIEENPNVIGQIRWEGVANNYRVEIRPKGTTQWSYFTSSDNQFNTSAISAPGIYELRVQSVCASKISAYSAIFEFEDDYTCPTISNLYIWYIRQEEVMLRWLNVIGAKKFNLYLYVNGAWTLREIPIDSVIFGQGDMRYVLKGLQPGTQYTALLRAVCQDLVTGDYYEGYAQNEENFETTVICGKPENLMVSNIGQTSAHLSWDHVSGAVEYRIYYYDYANNHWTTNSSLDDITVNYKTIEVDVSSLVTVRVVAYCSSTSFGEPSDSITFESLSCETPNITITNIQNNAATIGWDAPVASTIAVEIYRAFDDYWSIFYINNSSSVTFTPYLLENTVHYARVVFMCGGGLERAERSPIVPFRTLSSNDPVGIAEISNKPQLKVFPNPATAFLTIDASGTMNNDALHYEIRNLYGVLIQQNPLKSENEKIDVSHLASGIYILETKNVAYRESVKFVKI